MGGRHTVKALSQEVWLSGLTHLQRMARVSCTGQCCHLQLSLSLPETVRGPLTCSAGLSSHETHIWAATANSALKEYGDEGSAIRAADSAVNKHRRAGQSKGRSAKQ